MRLGQPLPPGHRLPLAEGGSAHASATDEATARLRVLVDLSRQLAEAESDLELVLDTVSSHIVAMLGDGGAVFLLMEDNTRLEPVTIHHRNQERCKVLEQINAMRKLSVGEGFTGSAVATGKSVFLPIADPVLVQNTAVPEFTAYLEHAGISSLLVVPLSGKDRVHGAFWLARDSGSPPYTPADLELLEAIADCAALAMDSARLHARHREDRLKLERAAAQTARLQQVTAALSGAATPQEVADVVAHIAIASMEGVAGSLVLPNEARTDLEIVSHVGHTHTPHIIQRFQTLPVIADNPVALAYREGKAFFFENLTRYGEQYPALLAAASEAGYQAAAALPLISRGEVLGVLWVRFTTPRVFEEAERGLMSTMMEQSAQALERARLYTRAQRAVAQRDELLSVVAHELRTPLAAMKLQIQSLQRNLVRSAQGEDTGGVLSTKADAVDRQVKRLEALVTDLLDLSQLTAGKLMLRIEEVDLVDLVHEVCERMAEEASRAKSPLLVHAEGSVWGQWDRARVDQVLSNLLGNALKYAAGKPIEITVSTDGHQARLAVRDQGIGIPLEDHVRIFERFERAVPGQNYSGFGVGLWICRQSVLALGGRIRVAQSTPGHGSTFEVTLPCQPS